MSVTPKKLGREAGRLAAGRRLHTHQMKPSSFVAMIRFGVMCLVAALDDDAGGYRRLGLEKYRAHASSRLTHATEHTSEPGRGLLMEAVHYFELAVRANGSEAVNYAYLGNGLFRLGQFESAERAYTRAIALDPNHAAKYHSNLGSMLTQQKLYEKALKHFAAAKELDPNDSTLAKNYDSAELLWKLDTMVDALRGNTSYFNVSGLLDGTTYSEKAEVAFTFVTEQRPDLIDTCLSLLRTARATRPGFAIVSHLLANTLVLRGNTSQIDEARTVLQSSLLGFSAPISLGCLAASPRLLVASVSSSPHPQLAQLRLSVQRCGYRLDTLGMGETWRGLGSKIALLAEYLQHQNDNDLILFVDAYDVLLLEPASQIVRTFMAFGKHDVVFFGAETNCAPDRALHLLYPPRLHETPFRYLNSGSYLGSVFAVKAMLRDVATDVAQSHVAFGGDPFRFDDQRWFARFALANPERVELDTKAAFFHTLHGLTPGDLSLVDKHPGTLQSLVVPEARPALIHGNGNGIDTFHALCAELRLRASWPSSGRAYTTITSALS